jgi:hypothetical protein
MTTTTTALAPEKKVALPSGAAFRATLATPVVPSDIWFDESRSQ